MTDDALWGRLRRRLERRLSASPRPAALNALLFAWTAVPLALLSLLSSPYGVVDGRLYVGAFLWNVGVLLHALLLYRRSGGWDPYREQGVKEQVLDAAEDFDLSEDDLLALYRRLSDDLRQRAAPFARVLLTAAGSVLLWLGALLLAALLSPNDGAIGALLASSMVATVLLNSSLAFSVFRRRTPGGDDALRAIYGGSSRAKRKHSADVGLSDDGELIYGDEQADSSQLTVNGEQSDHKP